MAEISSKNTKNEILRAYNELVKKMEAKEEDNPKIEKEKAEKKETVEKASDHTVDKIIKGIGDLKLDIAGSLDKVEDSLLNEFKKLEKIQEAIKIEKKNLEDLYGISTNAHSLAAMILAQKEKREQFEEEMSKKKDNMEADLNNKKQQLENEIETKRSEWAREKKIKEEEIKEQDQEIKKKRTREEEEYQYNLKVKRKKEEDEYNARKVALEQELQEKQVNFEKDIKIREENIVAREKEFNELKEKAEKFPGVIEETVKNKEAEISEKLSSQYKYEKELLSKEVEGELKLKNQTIKTLEQKIKDLENIIKELSNKADEASHSVKDIALRAIDSSSKFQFHERQVVNKNTNESGKEKE